MEKIVRHLKIVSKALIYYVWTYFQTKDEKLWLFGAWKGSTYNDNSKYLFEYVINNCPGIKAFWITKNKSVYDYVSRKGYPVLMYPSKEAEHAIAHAGYLFQTEGYKDTGLYPVGRAKVIQLWHGSPAKSLSWFKRNTNFLKDLFIRIENGDRRRFFWTSNSNFYSEFYHNELEIELDHFINTGSPRCDSITNDNISIVDKIKSKYGFDKVILYLPTHRNWGKDFDLDFVLNGLKLVDQKLQGSKIGFIYKPHPNEVSLIKNYSLEYKNIVLLEGNTQEQQDLYQYLFRCDSLISDYSSVIHDYLLCGHPIILFTYDIEHYIEKDGGVPKEYFDRQIGPMVNSWDAMINTAIEMMENDSWKDKRSAENLFFNEYNNGNSCKKIVDYIFNAWN